MEPGGHAEASESELEEPGGPREPQLEHREPEKLAVEPGRLAGEQEPEPNGLPGPGEPEKTAPAVEPGGGKPKGLSRMRMKFNLEEGKLNCNCLRRKWKFCTKIKDMAGGRVTPTLLKTSSRKEIEEKGRVQGEGREQGRKEKGEETFESQLLRLVNSHQEMERTSEGDASKAREGLGGGREGLQYKQQREGQEGGGEGPGGGEGREDYVPFTDGIHQDRGTELSSVLSKGIQKEENKGH